ncbi:MAG: FKBP-type peptidyl-prolyl cis-trans isomerase [Gammaproteobacteria bacterium]|nr:FKBP-type peptidyl-prolyl cis-trans isomerase [Gammaproteobacteria bacterium]
MKVVLNTTLLMILLLLCLDITYAVDNFQLTAKGALYNDLKTGTGEMADIGDVATIHFTSWFDSNGAKGKEIYNTRRENQTVSFVVGTDKIMPGWNEGVIGMKTGGKRLLKLRPSLVYGAKGVHEIIPPNARLIFEIDLIQLKKQLPH